MFYRLLSYTVVFIHLAFVLFMLAGFFFNIYAFLFNRNLFKKFYFRTFHLAGIMLVIIIIILDKYCPLTLLETYFYRKAEGADVYESSFLLHYIGKFLYPGINPALITGITVLIAVVSIVFYIFYQPWRNIEIK